MAKRAQSLLTKLPVYFIVEVDTLIEDENYHAPESIKAYSIIKVTERGACEVDRAYRTIREAMEAWPEAMPYST